MDEDNNFTAKEMALEIEGVGFMSEQSQKNK